MTNDPKMPSEFIVDFKMQKNLNKCIKSIESRVPGVAQWVKNLTTVAQVTAEGWIQSLDWCSGLKDLVLTTVVV